MKRPKLAPIKEAEGLSWSDLCEAVREKPQPSQPALFIETNDNAAPSAAASSPRFN